MRRFYPPLALILLVAGLLFLALSDGCAAPLRTAGDRPINIKHILLDLRVDLPKKNVDARATLHVRSLRPLQSVALDAVGLEVRKVLVGTDTAEGHSVPFHVYSKRLVIDLQPAWPAGHDATLRIDYHVHAPKGGLYFFGPTKTDPDIPLSVWSQGESILNRNWIPCLDQPDQKQTSEIIATVPEGFDVLSNGKLVDKHTNPSTHTATFHWLQDKPHASYLITLVVGQFDIVKDQWHGKPVLYYVPKGHKAEIAPTFGRTPEMLTFFSKRFGIEYPWDKYAQVVVEQFIEGGMENTSATTLTDQLLTDQRTLLDRSPDGVISHELTHQWWGDLVTCRDWAHTWLNEGFATFGEVLWAEHAHGPDEMAYNLWQKAGAAMAGDGRAPVVDHHYATPDSMFDQRVYPKGGWILHMLRCRLGEDAFWRGMKLWGERYRYQSVETSQFRRTMEDVSGRSLERFFYDWTERPGHPLLDVKTVYQPGEKQAQVTVKQTQSSDAFEFPLKVAFTCGQGKPIEVEENITTKEHTFKVPLSGPLTMVEIDPGVTLLAQIKETKNRDLWLAQLRSAASVPARIRAVQHLAASDSAADREALAEALAGERFWGVRVQIADRLRHSGNSACRKALITGLKDTDARVRAACAKSLASFRHDTQAASAVKALLQKGDPSYAVQQSAMSTLASLEPTEAVKLAGPLLEQPSYHDVLRQAALSAFGAAHDPSTFGTVVKWSKQGKSRNVRAAAIRALAEFINGKKLSPLQQKQAIDILVASLDETEPRSVQFAALSSLRSIGQLAAPAMSALKGLSERQSNDFMRRIVDQMIDSIKSAVPADNDVQKLRKEVERLRRENEALKKQLRNLRKAA